MRVRYGLGVCVALMMCSGCGSSSSDSGSSSGGKDASKSAPVTILSIGDSTGPSKLFGGSSWLATQAAAAYYNANGGMSGHKVVVRHVSDNGNPATAVSVLLRELSSGSPPTMVIAGSTDNDTGAMIPVLAKRKQFVIAHSDGPHLCVTDASTKCPHVWTLLAGSALQEQAAVQWFSQRGIKKLGVLEESTTYSQAQTPALLAATKKAGIATSLVGFPATAVNLQSQMQKLKSEGVDAVYVEAVGVPSGYALKARAALGWKVPLIFDVAASSLDLTTLAPASMVKDNAFMNVYHEMNPENKTPGIANLKQYIKPFGKIVTPLPAVSVGWDPVVALAAAIKQTGGSLDVDDLDAAMLKLPPTDPNYTLQHQLGFSTSNHENVLGAADDYEVLPAGPIVDGQVASFADAGK